MFVRRAVCSEAQNWWSIKNYGSVRNVELLISEEQPAQQILEAATKFEN